MLPATPSLLPSTIQALTDEALTKYLGNFLDMHAYRSTIMQGKELKILLKTSSSTKKTLKVLRQVLQLLKQSMPVGKLCSLQFLKDALEVQQYSVIKRMEKQFLPFLVDVVEYRSWIPSINRGSSYFIQNMKKTANDDHFNELVKISNTYFRMGHQILYIWGGTYFPDSNFGLVYRKLIKNSVFPQFPSDFKFYSVKSIDQVSKKLQPINQKFKELKEIEKYDEKKQTSAMITTQRKSQEEEKYIPESAKDKQVLKQKPSKTSRSVGSAQIQKKIKKIPKIKKKLPQKIIYREESYDDVDNKLHDIDQLDSLELKEEKKKEKQIWMKKEKETVKVEKIQQPNKNESSNSIFLQLKEQSSIQEKLGNKDEIELEKSNIIKKNQAAEASQNSQHQMFQILQKVTQYSKASQIKSEKKKIISKKTEEEGEINQKKLLIDRQRKQDQQSNSEKILEENGNKMSSDKRMVDIPLPTNRDLKSNDFLQTHKNIAEIPEKEKNNEKKEQISSQQKSKRRKMSFQKVQQVHIINPSSARNSFRKFKKFREVSLTLIPEQKNEIKSIKEEKIVKFTDQIVKNLHQTQDKIKTQNKAFFNELKNDIVLEIDKKVQKSLQNSFKKTPRGSTFFNEKIHSITKQKSTSRNSSQSKTRRSFSKDKYSYQNGTLLYVLSKRRSIF